MSAPLAAGTRVTATVYGESRIGAVVRQNTPNIVWVRWDGARVERWMHRESLTVIPSACATGRYKVTSWHGEAGSIFCVVDTHAPQDEQPAVVREYSTRALAVMSRDNLNAGAAS